MSLLQNSAAYFVSGMKSKCVIINIPSMPMWLFHIGYFILASLWAAGCENTSQTVPPNATAENARAPLVIHRHFQLVWQQ